MKRNYILCVFASLFCLNLFATDQLVRVSLAEWTFDWCTPAVAATTSKTTAVAPDRGKQVSTAFLATENLTGSGRSFSWPSSTGYYVYCTNMNTLTPEKYWWVYGLNTIGCTNIQLSSKHSNSSGYTSGFKIQYRIGGANGTWTDFYGPFDVTKTVTLNNATAIGDGPTPELPAILPAACEEQSSLEIRYLMTTAQNASAGQVRIDAVIVTAMMMETTTDVNKSDVNKVKVVATNGKIKILGAEGLKVTIYTVTGSKVYEAKSLADQQEINVTRNAIYVVKIAGKAYKISL